MDFEQAKAAIGEPLPENTESMNGWADPFERWMELADLLLRENTDPKSLRH
jgi:hypothetical protein